MINDFKEFDVLSKILSSKGKVEVIFEINEKNKKYIFSTKDIILLIRH